MALENHSTITEFILLGLSADPHVQALSFVIFLVIYLLTVLGNLTMMLVVRTDSHLHTPMYFLSHIFPGFLLLFCHSTQDAEILLSQKKTVSVEACLAQVFFVFDLGGTEACLLSVMAYAAICHPLL